MQNVKRHQMNNLIRFSGLFAGLLFATSSQALVININAANATGVTVALEANTDYTLTYASGGTPGATYLAWNPWGFVSGCDVNGTRCSNGFSELFNILGTGGNVYTFATVRAPYVSALLANSDAVSGPIVARLNGGPWSSLGSSVISFRQINAVDAVFFIPDTNYSDNTGGVSLILTNVNSVPEPESYALTLVGLALVGAAARRRKSA
jgi:hypothetical protein